MSPTTLSPVQTHALFDILIHHQLYTEIKGFKYSTAIDQYGFPFRKADGVQTKAPLLQSMLNKFVLRLPGLNHIELGFWQDKVRVLIAKLGEAELSESYDKGAIGSRKALATAISSLLEYVGRGMLGGFPVQKGNDAGPKTYDSSKAADILQAWDNGMRQLIYGDLLDELVDKMAVSDKLEQHSSLIQAAHEYILLNLASFCHHIFIMSPDGQYLLRLIENVHRLIPYTLVRQTLRVGNAATMINGMVRLVLAKLSVTAVTNWIGLTNNTNDGMNLLQQIISTVMAWDTAEFQKQAQKLESSRDAPKKEIFKAIKNHVYASRDTHDAARNISIAESKSIVAVILETANPPIATDSLNQVQHNVALEYYSTYLSIRDREELTKVLCKMQPDLLTSAIKDLVSAFDPVIRSVHKAVDLSGTVTDVESFLNDLIKVSKPKKANGTGSRGGSRSNSRSSSPNSTTPANASGAGGNMQVPTVEDYVQLLRKHMSSSHRFLHQVCKNAPDLADEYRTYVRSVLTEFRVDDNAKAAEEKGEGGAGNMTAPLHSMFSSLPNEKQGELKKLLDQHEKHLGTLKNTSHTRLEDIISSAPPSSSSDPFKPSPQPHSGKGMSHGPGMYLSRWHSLLNSAYITPATLTGPVRRGWEVKGELNDEGRKTTLTIPNHKPGSSKDQDQRIDVTEGTGDLTEKKERKRDGMEEDKIRAVWEGLENGWIGVCRGLEVMGD